MRPNRIRNTEEKFWARVQVGSKSECWPWTGSKNKKGYGEVSFDGKVRKAHRMAFVFSGNKLTKDKPLVCHKCDNPSCCNPAHLFAGNNTDNMVDMAKKHRYSDTRGEKNGRAKISYREAMEIRDICKSKAMKQRDIAKAYGVGKSTVNYINTGAIWNYSLHQGKMDPPE